MKQSPIKENADSSRSYFIFYNKLVIVAIVSIVFLLVSMIMAIINGYAVKSPEGMSIDVWLD